jgi:predicted DNA-binding transcriptional regulator AlpA/DNA-binding cell septation regulator SpoVG
MGAIHNAIDKLLNEHDVARITGLSVASVRRWRLLRQGPKYLKIGAAVRYKPEDISAWLESRPNGGRLPGAVETRPTRANSAWADGGRRRISVSDWKPLNCDGLRGFLTLSLPSGLVIHKCQLIETGGGCWVGLPAHRFQAANGSIHYVPLIDFATKSARRDFESAALEAVERFLRARGEW